MEGKGYLTAASLTAKLAGYATREWVTSQEYLTSADLPTNHVTTDTAQTVTAAKTFTALQSFTAGIRIGSATLTWDAAAGAVRVSAGLYSDSFIAARGVGEDGSAGSAGLDEAQLARYLSLHGYITTSALTGYATQSWVQGQDYVDFQELDGRGYVKKSELPTNHVTTDTVQTVTAAKTFAALATFNAGIKIGEAVLTWDATNRALQVSKSIYSQGAVSAKGIAVPIGTADGTVSLWGQSFDGTNDLRGNIIIDPEGKATASQTAAWASGKNPIVQLVKGSLQLALNIGSTGTRGLWCGDRSSWLIAYNPDTKKIQYLSDTNHTFDGQIQSTVATGTAPLSVASTTVVANLNADMVDGKHASELGGGKPTALYDSTGTAVTQMHYNSRGTLQSIAPTTNEGVALGDSSYRWKSIVTKSLTADSITADSITASSISIPGPTTCRDITPSAQGYSCGSAIVPFTNGYFTNLYIGGKLIDFSNLGSASLPSSIPTSWLGTSATTAAKGNHTHSGYAASNHTHTGYAASSHTHDYASISNAPSITRPNSRGLVIETADGLYGVVIELTTGKVTYVKNGTSSFSKLNS